MAYVVSTQYLENYGAHTEDGKFVSGNAYWKFKGGDNYLIDGVDRPADAMAFVHAYLNATGVSNTIGGKEFPSDVKTYADWMHQYDDHDEDAREFYMETLITINVKKFFEGEWL
jgi:hypothetical protein